MSNINHFRTFRDKTSLILLIFVAIFGIVFSKYNEKNIFPSINTPILLNKEQAIKKAKALNNKSPLELSSANASASYSTNDNLVNYLSLEDKSNQLLNNAIDKNMVQTSFWTVRLYKPKEIQENLFNLTIKIMF